MECLILSSHICLGFPSGLQYSFIRILNILLISSTCVTCPTHLIVPDFVIQIVLLNGYKLWISSVYSFTFLLFLMSDVLCSQTLSIIYSTTYWSYLLHFLWCFHSYVGHQISDNEQLNLTCKETHPVRWMVINMPVIASELCNKCYCIYRLGLDPKVLMETVNSSSGRCWSSEVYCPVPGIMDNVPSSNDYKVISLIMLQCILYMV